VHHYAKSIAQRLTAASPARYTTAAGAQKRNGKLFIDYLRNGRGCTAVGAYSPRARPGLPVAMPVSWKEIERGGAPTFTLSAACAAAALRRPRG
jgi:bifunctional non-homologous end joining protein LigD